MIVSGETSSARRCFTNASKSAPRRQGGGVERGTVEGLEASCVQPRLMDRPALAAQAE